MKISEALEYMRKFKEHYTLKPSEELLLDKLPGAYNILNVALNDDGRTPTGWTPEYEQAQNIYDELEGKLSERGKTKLDRKIHGF